jgi:hypothetical protein
MNLKTLGAIAGSILALGALAGGSWAIADKLGVRPTLISEHRGLQAQFIALKAAREQDRWFYLERKRLTPEGLTAAEYREWCVLGLRLGFIAAC